MSGIFRLHARPFAADKPTSKATTRPGPRVTATASTSLVETDASSSAASSTGAIISTWRRAASSGTTPPKRAWISCCEATTLERTRGAEPSPNSSTEAAVSSQLVSTPRIYTFILPALRKPHQALVQGDTGIFAANQRPSTRRPDFPAHHRSKRGFGEDGGWNFFWGGNRRNDGDLSRSMRQRIGAATSKSQPLAPRPFRYPAK